MQNHLAPHWESQETDQQRFGHVANQIQALGEQSVISEQDLERIYHEIEASDFPKATLQNIMLLLGSILRKRKEEDLRYWGASLILAAKAELPVYISHLENSLPDSESAFAGTVLMNTTFMNSLVLGEPPASEEPYAFDGPVDASESDLMMSGIFADEDDEKVILPARNDARLRILERLKKEEKIGSDERVRDELQMSPQNDLLEKLNKIPRIRASINSTMILVDLQWVQEQEKNELHVMLGIISVLKEVINEFLNKLYQEVGIRHRAKNENYTDHFFSANPHFVRDLLEVDKELLEMETQCQEIVERKTTPYLQLQSITPLYQEVSMNLPMSSFATALGGYVMNLLREMETQESADQKQAEEKKRKKIKGRMNECVQNISRLRVQLPDPWI